MTSQCGMTFVDKGKLIEKPLTSQCGMTFVDKAKLIEKPLTICRIKSLPQGETYSYLGKRPLFRHTDCGVTSHPFFANLIYRT